MDAAHVVLAPLWGIVWWFQRLLVKAPSGRPRLNVLAVLNALRHERFTGENLTSITSATVCELWRLLASTPPGLPITMILENARDQRGALGQAVAQA